MASQAQTSLPTAGWEQDLGNLPRLQHERIVEFYKEKAETRRCLDRSYNFFVECYVDPASIKVNYTNKRYRVLEQKKGYFGILVILPYVHELG
ncbi:hypothetical protein MTO96_038869 [Rhipicephalus appendiculatus]